jgi:2'-5' RNA ligase
VSDERARLFVALELPPGVRARLDEWRRRAFGEQLASLRLVSPESLHVTLCFLGWRAVEDIEPIAAACEGAVRGPAAELSLGAGLWLAPRGRPRVAGVRIEDRAGTLAGVQSALSDALAAAGRYAPEHRAFVAHVTVARVARAARVRPLKLPAPEPLAFTGVTVTLFRSRLARGGARYEPLRVFALASA